LQVWTLKSRNGAIRLPGSSHAETAFPCRGDVRVGCDSRVIEKTLNSRDLGPLLMRDGAFVEGRCASGDES